MTRSSLDRTQQILMGQVKESYSKQCSFVDVIYLESIAHLKPTNAVITIRQLKQNII